MIDRDLAELYQVPTKVLNQAVNRNIECFPEAFKFQLNSEEKDELVTNCDRFKKLKHSSINSSLKDLKCLRNPEEVFPEMAKIDAEREYIFQSIK
jgi:hypothetical protein